MKNENSTCHEGHLDSCRTVLLALYWHTLFFFSSNISIMFRNKRHYLTLKKMFHIARLNFMGTNNKLFREFLRFYGLIFWGKTGPWPRLVSLKSSNNSFFKIVFLRLKDGYVDVQKRSARVPGAYWGDDATDPRGKGKPTRPCNHLARLSKCLQIDPTPTCCGSANKTTCSSKVLQPHDWTITTI